MGYIEQVKLANDQAFLDQVRIAMVSAAVAIQGEAVGASNNVFQKRQQLATKILNDPDVYINRFTWATVSNTSIVRGNPVGIASSTNANPTVITTSAAHGLATGDIVVIAGHLVNTAANGSWTVTNITSTTFSIPMLASGVGGASGTVMKMPTDVSIQNQVNGVFNDIAGVLIND